MIPRLLAEFNIAVHRYAVVERSCTQATHNCENLINFWIHKSDAPSYSYVQYRHYPVLFISVSLGLQEHQNKLLSKWIECNRESNQNGAYDRDHSDQDWNVWAWSAEVFTFQDDLGGIVEAGQIASNCNGHVEEQVDGNCPIDYFDYASVLWIHQLRVNWQKLYLTLESKESHSAARKHVQVIEAKADISLWQVNKVVIVLWQFDNQYNAGVKEGSDTCQADVTEGAHISLETQREQKQYCSRYTLIQLELFRIDKLFIHSKLYADVLEERGNNDLIRNTGAEHEEQNHYAQKIV